jgi:putative SOS response-associated peptidase YedK
MCGRYGFSVKNAKEVYERFDIVNTLDDYKPRWNIAPGELNPVISRHSPKQIHNWFWGLIPFWAKDDSFRFKTINARSEGIENKPVYRKPFRTQRCLIPSTGFFEWDKAETPSQPYFFTIKNNPIFSMAGLYDIWKDPKTGREIYSYTIITTEANEIVRKVHPRMPVILAKEDEDEWINPDLIEPQHLFRFLKSYDSVLTIATKVSTLVNKPLIDSAEIIKKID